MNHKILINSIYWNKYESDRGCDNSFDFYSVKICDFKEAKVKTYLIHLIHSSFSSAVAADILYTLCLPGNNNRFWRKFLDTISIKINQNFLNSNKKEIKAGFLYSSPNFSTQMNVS